MGPTGLPFDDIRALFAQLPGPDEVALQAVRARADDLVAPAHALGRLQTIAEWCACWQGRGRPAITRPVVAVFAGSHGIAGDSGRNRAMVETLAAGGAAINQVCAAGDLGLKVFDLALDMPTGDIRREAALEEKDCAATIAYGMEAVAGGTDLLCLGAIGAGNETVAAALCAGLFGGTGADWGDEDAQGVDAALSTHAGRVADPLEALRRLGGREFAAIAGAILAARSQRVPVILDGFAACTAAAVLHRIDASSMGHCLPGHVSAHPGHARLAGHLGMEPLLSLGIALGEGTGAALAAGIVRAAVGAHAGMATRQQAGLA